MLLLLLLLLLQLLGGGRGPVQLRHHPCAFPGAPLAACKRRGGGRQQRKGWALQALLQAF